MSHKSHTSLRFTLDYSRSTCAATTPEHISTKKYGRISTIVEIVVEIKVARFMLRRRVLLLTSLSLYIGYVVSCLRTVR